MYQQSTDNQAARRQDLILEAGRLNNNPALVNVDHVTIMGLMDVGECEQHVARLRAYVNQRRLQDCSSSAS